MVEEERNETLYKAVGSLPEIQRRRFLLYYEYEFNFYQIAAMEHCTASAIQKSVAIAKEKVKAEIEEISPTVTDTARKRNLFFICVGLAALHTLTFFRGSKSIFKEVNAYVQRKQRHRPKRGSFIKMICLVTVAIILLAFLILNAERFDMIIESCKKVINVQNGSLLLSVGLVVCLVLYYLSYRITCRLYLKGGGAV